MLLNFSKKKKFNYKKKLILLHCNSAYPSPFKDTNLNVIPELKKKFGVEIGFSDHTLSDECTLSAVAIGAKVIEKHITLNKTMKGPDHASSLNGIEFKKMVAKIRNIEIALGSKIKKLTNSASVNKKLMLRSIVARKKIFKGQKFSYESICSKRPAGGVDPRLFFKLLNKKSKNTYSKNHRIKFTELK